MDIFLSGDIRKDKRVDGYVLNPNHYPISNLTAVNSGSSNAIDAFYNIILDSFDYSGNFIERKSIYHNRGTTGGGPGVLIRWGGGYNSKLYISGTSFTTYSGISLNLTTAFTYTDITKTTLNLRNLPDYTGLTITTATTLVGNVLVKLDEDYSTYDNTFNLVLDLITPDRLIPLSGSGFYNISFEIYGDDDFTIYDGVDTGGDVLYTFAGPNFYVLTSDTKYLTSGNLYLYNVGAFLGTGITINNLRVIRQNTGSTKLLQFNVENVNNDFFIDVYKNNEYVRRIDDVGIHTDKVDFIGLNEEQSWVNLFVKSNSEVKINNLKLFSLT